VFGRSSAVRSAVSKGKPIVILAVDGGGARGVIPANVLYLIEQRCGVDVRESFDFFAGVSTGALVACYCAQGMGTIEQLVQESYSSHNMSHVFDKSAWDRMVGRMQHRPKYDGINKREYVRDLAGGARINDITDKHLLVLAYDFINRELVTFKNRRGHDARYNPTIEEVCDAATAAPTLYPPVPTSDINRRWLIDGALATNDPSLCAITEALAMGYAIDEIYLVSLGTGRPVHDLSQEDQDRIGEASRDWGIYGWISNGLIDHMLGASSSVSTVQCRQLLGDRYLRVDGTLPRSLVKLDETSTGYVQNLQVYAIAWFEEAQDSILKLLKAARPSAGGDAL
jgi:patatin-like phospholipase/acyl hydrolase